ncbi:MAG: hypothetical protein OJF51_004726 [Nitrospira sp.]|jgi:hypothetical protein|nr:MAG: hypothetical protein OJF51_004726 [Nitrospira sp.]
MTDSNEKLKVSTDTKQAVYRGVRGPLVDGWELMGIDGAKDVDYFSLSNPFLSVTPAAIDESGQWKADKRHC